MKTTRLWKMVNKRFCNKTQKAAKEETGVAMIAVVMFMLIVGLTIAIITSVLLATLGPFRSSKLRSEGAYAAEAGLQTGLNYLRQLEADTTSDALFPSACGSSENTKFCQSTVNNTDIAKASTTEPSVAPNSSGTTFVSQTDSLKYEVQIAFFSGDPDNTPKQSDGTGGNTLKKDAKKNEAKYAVVVSRAIDSKGKVVRAMSGTYGFGENGKNNPSGSGRVGSPFGLATAYYNKSRISGQPLFPTFVSQASGMYDSSTKSMRTDIAMDLGNPDNGRLGNNDDTSYRDSVGGDGYRTMHPGNRTCIIASSYSDKVSPSTAINDYEDLFNKNISPSDGSPVFVFPQAIKQSGATNSWKFNPLCQSEYGQFNSFSYEEDGSIILANNSGNLCLTGFAPDDVSITEPHNGYVARLRSCEADESKKLEKMQIWNFDSIFVNAQFAFENTGGVFTKANHGDVINENARIQTISALDRGGYDGNGALQNLVKDLISDPVGWSDHATGGNIGNGNLVYTLVIRPWNSAGEGAKMPVVELDSDMETIGESLGRGGPALQIDSNGKRHHIVNAETGLCLNYDMTMGNCETNVGNFQPYCWRKYLRIKNGSRYESIVSSKNDWCSNGYQNYVEQGIRDEHFYDSAVAPDDFLTYTELASKDEKTVTVNFAKNSSSFPTSVTRVNGKDDKYQFKQGDNCLTIIQPGYYVNGKAWYNKFDGSWIAMRPYADWLPCGAEITDYYGRSVEDAQTWNGADNNSKGGGGGGGGGSQKATETSNGYNYVKELNTDANVTWK